MITYLNERFLLVTTRNKLKLVKFLSLLIQFFRKLFGLKNTMVTERNGIKWNLDLNEAIEFNIFLTAQYEVELARKMQEFIKAGNIVIDIGANIGGHTLPLSQMVGETGHVYAIEPTDFAFEKLQNNLKLNPSLLSRVTPIKTFLSDGITNLPQKVSASWSITGKINDTERNQFDMGYGKSVTNAKLMTLDELCTSLKLERLDAIKINVNGYEVEVLRGASETIEKFSPLIFIGFSPIHYEMLKTTFAQQVELLTGYGYSFEDVLGNELPSDVTELMKSIPRGALINVVAIKRSESETRKKQNELRLQELKEKLTEYMTKQRDSWSYLKVIKPGYASKMLYAIYMLETFHYTYHNSRNQAVIPSRKDEMDINYMKFCLNHASDEAGHEMMAFNDIRKLGFNISKSTIPAPLKSTQELIDYIYETAATKNPLARLGYSFWAERVYSYITPLLKLMNIVVGVPNKSMTFFNEHSDIDAEHAKEVDQAIVRFAKTEEDWLAIEECMLETLERTIKMTHEVLAEYDKIRANEPTRYDSLFEGIK